MRRNVRPIPKRNDRCKKAHHLKVFRGHAEKGGWTAKGPDPLSSNNYQRDQANATGK